MRPNYLLYGLLLSIIILLSCNTAKAISGRKTLEFQAGGGVFYNDKDKNSFLGGTGLLGLYFSDTFRFSIGISPYASHHRYVWIPEVSLLLLSPNDQGKRFSRYFGIKGGYIHNDFIEKGLCFGGLFGVKVFPASNNFAVSLQLDAAILVSELGHYTPIIGPTISISWLI